MSASFDLEGFEPISRLGGGGFGDVWLARQTNVDRQVAVKVGHSAIQDETIKLRFDRECKALGRLSGHPNIVDVYTAGSLKDGRPYLVLEYIDSGTLWQWLKKETIPEPELTSIGRQMAAALNEAHSSGVLHRDLKPENILIRSSGEAVLGDFGIARLHDGANTTSAAITASVAYAAPEILSGKRATVASDLYGIGICLLAAVFRTVPFVQKNDESIHPIITRVLSDRPPDVRRNGISEGLAALIDRLLSKDPALRPASAAELVRQFDALPRPETAQSDAAEPDATQVVAEPLAAPQPQPLATPQAAGHNLSSPRAEDAAPGLQNPNAPTPAMVAVRSQPPMPADSTRNPGTEPRVNPIESTAVSRTPNRFTDSPRGNLKLFALAYVLTLVIGGLGLFLASRMFDEEGSAAGEGAVAAATGTADAGGTAEDDQGAPESEDLQVPLTKQDITFGAQAEVTTNNPGPTDLAFCNRAPAAQGILDWEGQTFSADSGIMTLSQVVNRFESANDAAEYLDAYVATNSCTSWTVPDAEDGSREVSYQAAAVAAPVLGEDARRIDVTGAVDGAARTYISVVLLQSGSDVLALRLSSPSEAQVAEVNQLAVLAADRLGFGSGS